MVATITFAGGGCIVGEVQGETCDSGTGGGSGLNVYGWSFGATSTENIGSETGGAGAGTVTLTDVTFTTNVTSADLALFANLQQGVTDSGAVLSVQSANGDEIDFKLTDVALKSIDLSDDGASTSPNPMMTVELVVAGVSATHTPSGGDNTTINSGWQQVGNATGSS